MLVPAPLSGQLADVPVGFKACQRVAHSFNPGIEIRIFPHSHNADGSSDQVVSQFGSVLTDIQPNVVISVGHWPVVDPMLYRRISREVRGQLTSQKIKVLVGVGQISPAYKALLDEGLVHGLVSIDFTEIGRVTYEQMKKAAAGEPVAEVTHTHKRLVYPEWLVTHGPSESSSLPVN